jgi:hypothetical protein
VALVGACSFSMTGAPPQLPDSGGLRCDDDLGRPMSDGVGFVATAGLSVAAFASRSGRDRDQDGELVNCLFEGAFGGLMILPASVYAVAMVTGVMRRSRCRARRAEYTARAAATDGLWVTCKNEHVDGVWRATYVIENLTDRAVDYQLVARMGTRDRTWVSPPAEGSVAAGQSDETIFRPFGVGEVATSCSIDRVEARR